MYIYIYIYIYKTIYIYIYIYIPYLVGMVSCWVSSEIRNTQSGVIHSLARVILQRETQVNALVIWA